MGLLGVCACETVESSGAPFQPVAVAPVASGALGAALTAESDEPPFRMSFDGTTTRVESGPADVVAEAKAKEAAEREPKAEPGPMDALVASALAPPTEPLLPPQGAVGSALPSPTSMAPQAEPLQGGGWPVRLVKTIPDAQPPRAVLGLPNGKEIVVTPGTMVPEEGLIVVAVGPSRVQLSQVKPQGDHAAITSFTLDAMY
jgi:hypothetical protein